MSPHHEGRRWWVERSVTRTEILEGVSLLVMIARFGENHEGVDG